MGARHRRGQSSCAAGAPDGHGNQRHPHAAASMAAGVDGRRARAGGGNSGCAVSGVCRGRLSFDRNDGDDVRGRAGALAGGSVVEENRGGRSQPWSALFERVDRRGRSVRVAWNCHRSFARPGNFHACSALACCCVAAAVASRSLCVWSEDSGFAGHQQPLRPVHVHPSGGFALLFCA